MSNRKINLQIGGGSVSRFLAINKMLWGVSIAVISALLFGLGGPLAKIAYSGGSNGITMAFTRSLFAIPCLLLISKYKNVKFRIRIDEIPIVLTVCFFGNALTTIFLYISFSYISVGMATVLHFVFPIIVLLINALFFKEKIMWWMVVSLILGFCGVATFIGTVEKATFLGVMLALGSGLTYAFLFISMEHSRIKNFHYLKTAFYGNVITLFAAGVFGLATNTLHLRMTPTAWLYSIVVALMVGVGAFSLLKYAISICGSTTVSIFSMLEPITSIIFGWILLKEKLTDLNVLGCILILLGSLMAVKKSAKTATLDAASIGRNYPNE